MTDFTVSNAVVSIALLSKYVSKQTIHGTKVKKQDLPTRVADC